MDSNNESADILQPKANKRMKPMRKVGSVIN